MPSLYCALWAQVNVAISGNWALRNSETSSFAIVIYETLLGGWESDFSGCENKAKPIFYTGRLQVTAAQEVTSLAWV
jgi:hypothetical protein